MFEYQRVCSLVLQKGWMVYPFLGYFLLSHPLEMLVRAIMDTKQTYATCPSLWGPFLLMILVEGINLPFIYLGLSWQIHELGNPSQHTKKKIFQQVLNTAQTRVSKQFMFSQVATQGIGGKFSNILIAITITLAP